MSDPASFYVREGDVFASTELTRGPWDAASQHAGPPCALLGSALDAAGSIEGARLVRVSFEILGPVPIEAMRTEAEVVRPGRSVELIEGALVAGDRAVLRARAWRIAQRPVELGRPATPEPPAVGGPGEGEVKQGFPTGYERGYLQAMETRFVHGSYRDPGPAMAWMRAKVPLIEGEETTPLQKVLTAADSGNGVSSPLDYRGFVFINTDLTVTLRRPPEGDWIGLEAATYAEPDGTGATDTLLRDERGAIGRATQSLVVTARPAA